MKTVMPTKETLEQSWVLIDAEGMILGRLASQIATILRGKHKPEFAYHVDCGDHVVIINAEKVKTTGAKDDQKYYFRHTGFPGGGKMTYLSEMKEKKPEEVIRHAVKGMLPHNRLGSKVIKKLHVYKGADHPHQAQKPQTITLD